MSTSADTPESDDEPLNERDDLVFLRDEGLELLALYKRVRDPKRRKLIMELIRIMADCEPSRDR